MATGRRPTALGVALALVLVAGLVLAVVVRRGSAGTHTPGAAPAPVAETAHHPARPLVWAEGRTIHLGRRTVATGHDLLALDVTDDGVAYTTFDGLVWFTDGSRPQQIGSTLPARAVVDGIDWGPFGRPDRWVVSDNAGSRLAWLEVDEGDRLAVVVYDTARQAVVAQVPVGTGPRGLPTLLSVGDDRVYWTDGVGTGARVTRYDVSTDRRWRVPAAAYRADVGRRPRMLLLGTSRRFATLSDGVGQGFAFVGRRLRPRGGEWGDAWDAATGVRLVLARPPRSSYGFGVAERLELVEWLDDDRFVLLDSTGWNAGALGGEDLLVCRLSRHTCGVAVDRPPSARRLVVPEYSTPGSTRAAALAATRSRDAVGSVGGG